MTGQILCPKTWHAVIDDRDHGRKFLQQLRRFEANWPGRRAVPCARHPVLAPRRDVCQGRRMEPIVSRRFVLAQMTAGVSALAIRSACGWISPAAARAQGLALGRLSPAQGTVLEALGDTLLPGAAAAGVAHYVDDQLGRENPLLFLKYVDWTGPYLDFYAQGLESLDQLAGARFAVPFTAADAQQRTTLVREMAAATPAGWTGPPSPLFYFVVRNDALDVVYGTPEGLEKLEIPYMPHIVPPAKW